MITESDPHRSDIDDVVEVLVQPTTRPSECAGHVSAGVLIRLGEKIVNVGGLVDVDGRRDVRGI